MAVTGSKWLFTGILLGFLLPGCGSPEPTGGQVIGQAQCGSGAAQIGVGEGVLSILCGCQEPAGQMVLPPSMLTCTVSPGTYVFFQYIGRQTSHQILSQGLPAFQAGPLSQPHSVGVNPSHVVRLNQLGTYSFYDMPQPGVAGQIVVQ